MSGAAANPRGLTEQELGHFEEHGYVIVKGVLADDDFAEFEHDYTKLIDAKATELQRKGLIKSTYRGSPFDKRLAQIAAECSDETMKTIIAPFGLSLDTMYARARGFFNFQFSPRLLKCAESLVGPEITLSPIQHCRPFLPARGGQQPTAGAATIAPWHQDQGVTREEADASEIVTCWIPLTDVTAETGCLKLIPDVGNRVGLLEHVKRTEGTCIKDLPAGEQIDACMNRGDLLFMHKFTPHRSQTNFTDKVRWSLDLRFQKTDTPTGRPFWPEVVLQSVAQPDRAVRDYAGWARRWEHDLEHAEGQRWHRVAGDVGGSIGGVPTHTKKRLAAPVTGGSDGPKKPKTDGKVAHAAPKS